MPPQHTDPKPKAWTEDGILALITPLVKSLIRRAVSSGIGGGSGAPASASFVTVAAEPVLTTERRLVGGDGITLVDAGPNSTMTVDVDLDTDSGLEFDAGELRVDASDGLERLAAGLAVALAPTSGLEFLAGRLAVNLDSPSGLQLGAGGLSVDPGDGIEVVAGGVSVDIADNSLQFVAGDLAVQVDGLTIVTGASGLEVDVGPGLFVSGSGLTVELGNGLTFSGNAIVPNVGNGLEVDGSFEIAVDLAANPGLAFSGGDLTALVGNGLELTASGIEIDLAANPGLAFSSGDLTALVGNGLELTASGIEIDLAANSGLEFSGGDLQIDIDNSLGYVGLQKTATGLTIRGDTNRKTANETVNSSTTLQNDDHLLCSLISGTSYVIEGYFAMQSPAAADFQMDFTIPAGGVLEVAVTVFDLSNTLVAVRRITAGSSAVNWATADGETYLVHLTGTITTSFSGGTLQLRWAQQTSDAGSTTVLTGGHLSARNIP